MCSWLSMGCCWVETRGWAPKTGLGGSEQVPVSRERVLMGLNAVLGVERGVAGGCGGSIRNMCTIACTRVSGPRGVLVSDCYGRCEVHRQHGEGT